MTSTPDYAEDVAASFSKEWARQYRKLDEQTLADREAGNHYGAFLEHISTSFGRPIDVRRAQVADCGDISAA